jgi:hypothetical protein
VDGSCACNVYADGQMHVASFSELEADGTRDTPIVEGL